MKRKYPPGHIIAVIVALFCGATSHAAEATQPANEPFAVTIRVDAALSKGVLKPIWRFFGADEPNYAYMKDGRKLIQELGELKPQEVYFRTHSLLVSGDGTPALKWGSTGAYSEDAQGRPVYNWTIVDRIFDTYLERGVKPYVQIGFMPKELSIKPDPYQHQWTPKAKYDEIYTGWAYPPKDYAKWGELVYQWAKHSVEKYGRAEVEKWYWQVWNEPNIGYWRGTPQEFHKLHDYAIDAVRRALPSARVGGPDVAGGPGGKSLTNFLEHCVRGTNYATGQIGTPIDFISFHAKGSPTFVDGHVRMGIANQLRNINDAFGVVARFPELKDKPIVIGESDPDGCAACQGPQLGYRNGTMYSSYTAASFARKHELADRHGVNLEGALTWAFEFEDQPFFAGFRVLASNGIDLPVLNVFRMFSRMRGERLVVESDGAVPLDAILRSGVRAKPDVSALASVEKNKLWVMAWHYHDDDVAGADAQVNLPLSSLPPRIGKLSVRQFRIDERQTNPWAIWKSMGSPSQPTTAQQTQLAEAGRLRESAEPVELIDEGTAIRARFKLPRQAVALIEFEWAAVVR
ncbi:MAG: beta-xylosidase [Opitutaceae bacterium]|nr:beta-xylosidase [Verrucomicrobiales bacterium]